MDSCHDLRLRLLKMTRLDDLSNLKNTASKKNIAIWFLDYSIVKDDI